MHKILFPAVLSLFLVAPAGAQDDRKPVRPKTEQRDGAREKPMERREDDRDRDAVRTRAGDDDASEWQAFQKRHPEAAARIAKQADTDGDGAISPAERKAAHAAIVRWRQQHVQEDWQQFCDEHPEAAKKLKAQVDRNGDGTIDESERKAAHERMQQFRAERAEKMQQRAEQHPEAAQKVRERRDTNDDGKVGPRERHKARHEQKERRQDRRQERSDGGAGGG